MTLREILFNVLTVNLIVWIWDQTGHCIYAGPRLEAVRTYGDCKVTGWRIDGVQFRANILTETRNRDG